MSLAHSAIDTLRLVHDAGFRHVPVVAEELVVGIVSAVDFRAVEHDRLDDESGCLGADLTVRAVAASGTTRHQTSFRTECPSGKSRVSARRRKDPPDRPARFF